MKFNYDRVIQIALDQITKFGQQVTITRKVQGSYNPATSSTTVTETTETGQGLVDSYKWREIDGTLIQLGDKKLILAASGITRPTNNDKVTFGDGTKYQIKNVDILSPSGVDVLYTCQLRK